MAFSDILNFISPTAAGYNQLKNTSFFKGKPTHIEQAPTKGQDQIDLQTFLGNLSQEWLSPDKQKELGGVAGQQFMEDVVPSLAERFTSLGVDPQATGAWQQQLARALSAEKGKLAQRQQQLIPSLLGGSLQPQFENVVHPREQSTMELLLAHLLPALIKAGGAALL